MDLRGSILLSCGSFTLKFWEMKSSNLTKMDLRGLWFVRQNSLLTWKPSGLLGSGVKALTETDCC